MKKLILFFFLTTILYGQFAEIKKPDVNLGRINQIHVQKEKYILTANDNSVFRSTDEGKNWIRTLFVGANKLSDLCMTDSLTGFLKVTIASGESETVIINKTTDGGLTWSQNKAVSASVTTASNLVFSNLGTGFFRGPDKKVYYTFNGGTTWYSDSVQFLAGKNSVTFGLVQEGTSIVYLAETGDSLFASISLLSSWANIPSSEILYSGSPVKLHVSKTHTLITNNTDKVYYLSNSGQITWISFPNTIVNAKPVYNSGAALAFMASAPDGEIFGYTTAGSVPLSLLKLPESGENYRGNAMYSDNSIDLYVAGSENYIIKSNTGGTAWSDLYGFAPALRDPEFSGLNGVSLSFGNQIYFSENGGASWEKSVMPESYNMFFDQVVSAGKNVFYAIGRNSASPGSPLKLYKSTDGGKSWFRKTGANEPVSFNRICFTDENRGFTSANGYIQVTDDGGDTWTDIYYATAGAATAFDFRDERNGIMYYNGGASYSAVIKTSDGGLSWSKTASPLYDVTRIIYVNNDTIFLQTSSGILRSTSGGTNFTNVPQPVPGSIQFHDIEYFRNKLWVTLTTWLGGTPARKTYYSNDLGQFWVEVAGSELTYLAKINEYYAAGISNANQISKAHSGTGNVLAVQNYNALKNDTVTVEILYSPAFNAAISAIQFDLSGWGSKLQFLDVDTAGADISSAGWMYAVNPGSGQIRLAMSGSKHLQFGGLLLKIKFRVIDSTGVAPTNITQAIFNTGLIVTDTSNGFVKIDRINPGDVDLNGSVQAFDAGMVLKFLTNQVYLSNLQKRNANVTTDNEITAFDASVILRYVVGLITSLPYGGTDNSTADYAMNNFNALPGSMIEVPLNLLNASGIYSADGYFTYDPSKLTFTDVVWDPGFSNFMKEVSATNGKINFAIAASQKKDLPSGMFARIRFTVNNGAVTGSSTSVELSKIRLNQNPASFSPVSSVISIVTSLDDEVGIPDEFSISHNYPNPFNPSTIIKYSVPEESNVRIAIYDISGSLVAEPVNRKTAPGNYSLNIDLSGRSSGVYICRMEAGGKTMYIKMNLIK